MVRERERNLIVFGEDWGGHPSATQHLVGRLADRWNVVWVNSIGLRRPRLNGHDIRRAASKVASSVRARAVAAARRPAQDSARFPVLSPLALPFPGSAAAQRLNGALLAAQLAPYLRSSHRPVLWTSLPTAVAAAGRLHERALVYYCGDDFGALAGVDHEPVLKLEAQLADRADTIFAASERLARRFPSEKTRLLPHGVDHSLFASPAPRAADMPQASRIAGFYGSLSPWIDVEALARAAASLPSWLFVLIGPVLTDVSPLVALPNVLLLGPRPHAALPSYVQHWHVSLLPFRANAQIEACNPLKLREYLASGTPVAATVTFPALAPYARAVCIARDGDLAEAILCASRDGEGASRRALVAGESWEARADEVHRVLEALL